MSRLSRLLLGCALGGVVASQMVCSGFCESVDKVKAPCLTSEIIVDGEISEPAWSGVPWNEDFTGLDKARRGEGGERTRWRVARDDQFLYVGIECDEPATKDMFLKSRSTRDGPIYADNSVEVFVDPGKSGESYYYFAVNHAGAILDAFCTSENRNDVLINPKWDADVKVATRVGENKWAAELAIPFSALDLPDKSKTWGVNVTRERRVSLGDHAKAVVELSSFVPMPAGFHHPECFAPMELVDFDPSPFQWLLPLPEAIRIDRVDGGLLFTAEARPVNRTGEFRIMDLTAELVGPNGNVRSARNEKLSLHADSNQSVPITLPLPGEGRNLLRMTLVRHAEPGKILCSASYPLDLEFRPVDVRFLSPAYKDCVFATQSLDAIEADVTLNLRPEELTDLKLVCVLKNETGDFGGFEVEKPTARNRVRMPIPNLPEGVYQFNAALINHSGKRLYETEKTLRKLPRVKGEVWFDQNNVCHVDGIPFFPLGWFASLPERSNPYCNVIHTYSGFKSMKDMRAWMDKAHAAGYKVLVGPYQEFRGKYGNSPLLHHRGKARQGVLTEEQTAVVRHAVEAFKDHPALLGWYMCDEPEGMDHNPDWYQAVYRLISEIDPYHPCVLLDYSIQGMRKYYKACDVLMPDCYPNFQIDSPPKKPMRITVDYVDAAKELNRVPWLTPQGFDWSLWRMGAGSKYEFSRGPTFDEFRCQAFLAVTRGVRGLVWYTHGHTRSSYHFRWGKTYVERELHALAPACLAPEMPKAVACSSKDVFCALRRADDHYYLIAVNSSSSRQEAEMRMSEGPSGNWNVIGEERSVDVRSGRIVDRFSPYETHVYTTNSEIKLPSINSLRAKIVAAEAKRRKKGNLLFRDQDSEVGLPGADRFDVGVGYVKPALFDGMTDRDALGYRNRVDKPLPRRISVDFSKPKKLGRIVVHARNLKGYDLSILTDTGWNVVKSDDRNAAAVIEATFKSQFVNAIRLDLKKAVHGGQVDLSEMEAYAK